MQVDKTQKITSDIYKSFAEFHRNATVEESYCGSSEIKIPQRRKKILTNSFMDFPRRLSSFRVRFKHQVIDKKKKDFI